MVVISGKYMTKKQLILVVMIIKGSFIGLGMMVIIHKGYLKAQIEPADKPIWFDEAAITVAVFNDGLPVGDARCGCIP